MHVAKNVALILANVPSIGIPSMNGPLRMRMLVGVIPYIGTTMVLRLRLVLALILTSSVILR